MIKDLDQEEPTRPATGARKGSRKKEEKVVLFFVDDVVYSLSQDERKERWRKKGEDQRTRLCACFSSFSLCCGTWFDAVLLTDVVGDLAVLVACFLTFLFLSSARTVVKEARHVIVDVRKTIRNARGLWFFVPKSLARLALHHVLCASRCCCSCHSSHFFLSCLSVCLFVDVCAVCCHDQRNRKKKL